MSLLQRMNAAANEDQPGGEQTDIAVARLPIVWLELARIHDNPFQPRQHYDHGHTISIAASLASMKAERPSTLGLQQLPLARVVVGGQPLAKLDYLDIGHLSTMLANPAATVELMFGHTRKRAFSVLAGGVASVFPDFVPSEQDLAGWGLTAGDIAQDGDYSKMPVMLGYASDESMWRHAITENSQRSDINPIEEANAMRQAIEKFGYTYQQAAQPFGLKSKGAVANKVRLLRLPAVVQQAVITGLISERHARELLRLEGEPETLIEVFDNCKRNGWTVEKLSSDIGYKESGIKDKKEKAAALAAVRAVLAQGWIPPGSTTPLPQERIETERAYLIEPFDMADSTDAALLNTGTCGSHCDCCVLAIKDYIPPYLKQPVRPVASIFTCVLGCHGTYDTRQAKRELLAATPGAIVESEAEQAKRAEDERNEQIRADLKATAEAMWASGLASLSSSQLLVSPRFWKVVAEHLVAFTIGLAASNAQTGEQMVETLLAELYDKSERYINAINMRGYDLEFLESILAALGASHAEDSRQA